MISDVMQLLFSFVVSLDYHAQDALLRVELNSFWFYCCHFLHLPFPLSLLLSMVRCDNILYVAISGYLIIY